MVQGGSLKPWMYDPSAQLRNTAGKAKHVLCLAEQGRLRGKTHMRPAVSHYTCTWKPSRGFHQT
jgi:hypothetical protein